ncbi:MAG: hypothetical protein NUV57_00200 [archaeon]|nr:hypothetical protein [archaeon]
MDLKNFLPIIVLIALALFLLIPTTSSEEKVSIDLDVGSGNFFSGEDLKVKINAFGNPDKIVVQLGSEKKEFPCDKICEIAISFNPKPGVYNLKAIASKQGIFVEKEVRIVVSEQKRSCVNNVSFGACSDEKPLYCDNGLLKERCSVCGCNESYFCSSEKCSLRAPKLYFSKMNFPSRVELGKEFLVSLYFTSEAHVPEGANYLVIIGLGKNSIEKNFSTKEFNAGESIKFELMANIQEAGFFDLNLTVFSLNENVKEIYTYFQKDALQSVLDIAPPAIPMFSELFVEGDDVVLSWTNVENASEYLVYKSADANPAFISYKFLKSFSAEENTGVIQALEKGTHFFVITASDEFGNESGYSEVKTALIQ